MHEKGFDLAVSYGLTMMHTYASEIYQYFENYDDYLELNRKGQLPVRITVCIDNFYNKPFVTKAEREDRSELYSMAHLRSSATAPSDQDQPSCMSLMQTILIRQGCWS